MAKLNINRKRRRILNCTAIVLATSLTLNAQVQCQDNILTSRNIDGDIEKQFLNPPDYAKPRVFWWWLNSMATKESITRDLEELRDKGFGGALIYDGGSSSYDIAKKTEAGPTFGSDEWIDNLQFALSEAERLGLEMSLTIQSGWNLGGPNVKPEQAFRKVAWTETIVEGPRDYKNVLPIPEGEYYNDVVIQAYPFDDLKEKQFLANWEYKSFNKRFKGFDEYPLHVMREQVDSAVADHDLKKSDYIELTNNIDENGILTWHVPEGKYKILRIGSVLTGAEVSTPSDGYSGLAIDYMNEEVLEHFFAESVEPILKRVKSYIGNTLKYIMTDSWEMGITNWSLKLREEFIQRRGYDPIPYMATLTGQIVDNREVSNRFLYDYRKTIGDCVADRHYKVFSRLAEKWGLKIHPESGGPHAAPIDGLKCLGRNDFPMGEFWARSNTHRFKEEHRLFIKQSASAAHIYGKRFVAGEGPTSIGPQWERAPKDLKGVFDRNFCEGINRFFWHGFTSSPKEFGLPGNEYFAGTHLNPNVTWWEQSKYFAEYLGRASYMLSQGLFVADVLMYYGDDVPVFANRKKIPEELGFGYDYDDCNAEVILERLEVKDGKLVLPDGMSYHVLRLPDREAISLDVLQKLEQLVKDGAIIAGQKPNKSTGLKDYNDSDKRVIEFADRLWGKCDGISITENSYGKGKVYWGKPLKEILLEKGIEPDFEFTSSQDSSQIDYIHRGADNVEIYYVVNRLARKKIYDTKYRYIPELPNRYERIDCSFKVSDMVPEIWNPMDGKIEEINIYKEDNGRITLPLYLEPEGSRFIVFRKKVNRQNITSMKKNGKEVFPLQASTNDMTKIQVIGKDSFNEFEVYESGKYDFYNSELVKDISVSEWDNVLPLDSQWVVKFNKDWGAPSVTIFDSLYSWSESKIDGIKYYSGAAEYIKEINVPHEFLNKDNRYYLDLGNVQEIAEVKINGISKGGVWKAPFKLDITDVLKEGKNEVKIKVTNLWVNRLVGDEYLPEEKRYTKTNIKKFTKEYPLRVSGLLGPVKIIATKIVKWE